METMGGRSGREARRQREGGVAARRGGKVRAERRARTLTKIVGLRQTGAERPAVDVSSVAGRAPCVG